jgi:hypothetical protein
VDAGGEVTAIDSAGFGPISITKAVTITSPDGVEAGIVPTAGGNAITISAGSNDAIVLHGLTINGSGLIANGVVFNSGRSLTVDGCVLQNFLWDGTHMTTGNGLLMQPTSGAVKFVITNTAAVNNSIGGIFYFPPSGSTANAEGVIDHVVATNNFEGIDISTQSGGGATKITIANSVASNNSNEGIIIANSSASLAVSIDNISATNNGAGIGATGPITVNLSRSVITANLSGITNNTSPNTFFSYKNNQIDGNSPTDISTPLNTHTLQ